MTQAVVIQVHRPDPVAGLVHGRGDERAAEPEGHQAGRPALRAVKRKRAAGREWVTATENDRLPRKTRTA